VYFKVWNIEVGGMLCSTRRVCEQFWIALQCASRFDEIRLEMLCSLIQKSGGFRWEMLCS
jgi:hypothetical protein